MNGLLKYIFTVFICQLLYFQIFGNESDSLLQVLNSSKGDDEKSALTYAALSVYYSGTVPDSAIHFAVKGVEMAEKARSPKALVYCYRTLGESYMAIDSLDSAVESFLQAEKYVGPSADSMDIITVYRKLSVILVIRAEYYRAMSYYHRALKIAEKLNDKMEMARIYNNMAIIEDKIDLDDEALKHYRQALGLLPPEEIAARGYVFGNTGIIYFEQMNTDSAAYYFNTALEIAKKDSDYYAMANMTINLGNVEFELRDNLPAAMDYYRKALETIEMMERTNTRGHAAFNKAKALVQMASIMTRQKNYTDAENYYTEAEKLATTVGIPEVLESLYPKQAELYELKGNKEKATLYYKKSLELLDNSEKQQAEKNTQRMIFEEQIKHELELKARDEQIIQEKQKRKETFYVLIIVLIIALLAAAILMLLLYWSRLQRQSLRNKNLQIEQQKLQQELEFKNKELAANLLEMVRKNNLLTDVSGKLSDLNKYPSGSNTADVRSMLHDLKREETDNLWEEFKKRFVEVNKNFYSRLHEKYPDLTPNEQKLCAFLYLNLSTKEIASITLQRYETVRTARYRLRSKLGLNEAESLVTFLHRLTN